MNNLKNVKIVNLESEAIQKSSMYIVPSMGSFYFIIVDDNGERRKFLNSIGSLPSNIATIDELPLLGNVYSKEQSNDQLQTLDNKYDSLYVIINDILQRLVSNDIDLDELQEVIDYIKENREQIEAIQQIIIGSTTDDKVTLTDNIYEGITTQNDLNVALWNAINEPTLFTTTMQGSGVITHNFNTDNFIVEAYDMITKFNTPITYRRISENEVEIFFDTTPTNDMKIIIKKL